MSRQVWGFASSLSGSGAKAPTRWDVIPAHGALTMALTMMKPGSPTAGGLSDYGSAGAFAGEMAFANSFAAPAASGAR
jgi:hypothetical protein